MNAALLILAMLLAITTLPLLTRLNAALRDGQLFEAIAQAMRLVLAVAAASLLVVIAGRTR